MSKTIWVIVIILVVLGLWWFYRGGTTTPAAETGETAIEETDVGVGNATGEGGSALEEGAEGGTEQ